MTGREEADVSGEFSRRALLAYVAATFFATFGATAWLMTALSAERTFSGGIAAGQSEALDAALSAGRPFCLAAKRN